MNRQHVRFSLPRAAAVTAMVVILLVGTLSAAYAADVGGLKKTVTLWVHGQPKDGQLEIQMDDGGTAVSVDAAEQTVTETVVIGGDDPEANYSGYTVTWEDEDGVPHTVAGGGVAMEADGAERPLTVDEIMEYLESGAEVVRTDEGRVMFYWYDNVLDITDRFVDGECRLSLERDGVTHYFVVRDEGDGSYNLSYGTDYREWELGDAIGE